MKVAISAVKCGAWHAATNIGRGAWATAPALRGYRGQLRDLTLKTLIMNGGGQGLFVAQKPC